MIETRRRLRFPEKSFLDVGPEREIGRKNLESDIALESPIHRAVDYSRASASDLILKVVRRCDRVSDACKEIRIRRRWRVGQAVEGKA
jgi:hypothetical protein